MIILLSYLAGLATAAAILIGWLLYQSILIDIEQNKEAWDTQRRERRAPARPNS